MSLNQRINGLCPNGAENRGGERQGGGKGRMTMDQSIETLRETSRKAQEAISEIETLARREANGPKVGKFYKTRNSYSCPEKPSDYWWVYEKVTRMDESGFLYTTQFQTDKHGKIFIEPDHYAYHMQYGTEIKPAVFSRAWAKLIEDIDAISPW